MFRIDDGRPRGLDSTLRRADSTDRRKPHDFVTENHETVNKEAEFLRTLVKPTGGNLNFAEQAFYNKAYRRLWKLRQQQEWTNNQKEGFNAKHAFLMAYRDTLTSTLRAELSTSISLNIYGASAWRNIRYIDTKQHKDDVTIQQQVLNNLEQDAYKHIKTALNDCELSVYALARVDASALLKTEKTSEDAIIQNTISNKNRLYTSLDTLYKQKWNNNQPDTHPITPRQLIDSIKDTYISAKAVNTDNKSILQVIGMIEKNTILSSFL